MAKTGEPVLKVIATNRKASHDFVIHERIEAGVALKGSEVKSLRAGRADLEGSFAVFEQDELLSLIHI